MKAGHLAYTPWGEIASALGGKDAYERVRRSDEDRVAPGAEILRDLNKLRWPEDEPDSPTYVRDRTPLKKGQFSSLSLRDEFRRDPALPILVDDDIFLRGVRRGVEQGEYMHQRGDLLYGPGDPAAGIEIDERSMIFTMVYAKNAGLWSRKPDSPPDDSADSGMGEPQVSDGTDGTRGYRLAEMAVFCRNRERSPPRACCGKRLSRSWSRSAPRRLMPLQNSPSGCSRQETRSVFSVRLARCPGRNGSS